MAEFCKQVQAAGALVVAVHLTSYLKLHLTSYLKAQPKPHICGNAAGGNALQVAAIRNGFQVPLWQGSIRYLTFHTLEQYSEQYHTQPDDTKQCRG
jgi:hypothetical protein